MEVRASSQIPSASLARDWQSPERREKDRRDRRDRCAWDARIHARRRHPSHRIFRQGLKCHRGDKTRRVLRHDNEDSVSPFDKFAGEVSGFVGGDGTGNAKDD